MADFAQPGGLDNLGDAWDDDEILIDNRRPSKRHPHLGSLPRKRCSRPQPVERLGRQDGALANLGKEGGLSTQGGPPFFVSTNRNLNQHDHGI